METSKEQREIGLLCYYDKGLGFCFFFFRVHFRTKYQESVLFVFFVVAICQAGVLTDESRRSLKKAMNLVVI